MQVPLESTTIVMTLPRLLLMVGWRSMMPVCVPTNAARLGPEVMVRVGLTVVVPLPFVALMVMTLFVTVEVGMPKIAPLYGLMLRPREARSGELQVFTGEEPPDRDIKCV